MKMILCSRRTMIRGLCLIVVILLAAAGFYGCSEKEDRLPQVQPTEAAVEKKVPIYFVETDEAKLGISFDAAWGCERTEKILAELKQYDVKATFFLTNIWLEDYPEMAKKIAADGHEIAMHSVSHPHMNSLSKEEMIQELQGNAQMIQEITGYEPVLFRFPFGEYNNQAIDVVQELGYYPIQWSIDSLDWKETLSKDDIVDRVVLNLHHGAIILCHNNGTYTAEAIAEIIPYAQKEGYQFVPIGQLIYKGAYQTDNQGMQKQPHDSELDVTQQMDQTKDKKEQEHTQ